MHVDVQHMIILGEPQQAHANQWPLLQIERPGKVFSHEAQCLLLSLFERH
jgi:hypothetical protein